MIKIISYVVIAFCYRKANILRRWSNIRNIFTGTKACVTAADLIGSDENLYCFTLPLSSGNIKISVVSQCRSTAGILWLFNISTHSLPTDRQLDPSGSSPLLMTWHCTQMALMPSKLCASWLTLVGRTYSG